MGEDWFMCEVCEEPTSDYRGGMYHEIDSDDEEKECCCLQLCPDCYDEGNCLGCKESGIKITKEEVRNKKKKRQYENLYFSIFEECDECVRWLDKRKESTYKMRLEMRQNIQQITQKLTQLRKWSKPDFNKIELKK